MKGKLITLFCLFAFISVVDAQVTFQKIISNAPNPSWIYDVKSTSDNGYIATGVTQNYATGIDRIYLLKLDSSADITWTKSFAITGQDRVGQVIDTLYDGGYSILVMSGGSPPSLIRCDSSGDTLWIKSYNLPLMQYSYDMHETSDSGFIFSNSVDFPYHLQLVKTDKNGNTLWSKIYYSGNHTEIMKLMKTSDNRFMLAGRLRTADSTFDCLVIKMDSTGNVLWSKRYGKLNLADEASYIEELNDGNYIVSGRSAITPTTTAAFLMKLNSAGDTLWTSSYGITSVYCDIYNAVHKTSDNGFLGFGTTYASPSYVMCFIKVDSSGNLQWAKMYLDTTYTFPGGFQLCSDGGYFGMGGCQLNGYKVYLLKLDSSGNTGCNDVDLPLQRFTNPIVVNDVTLNVDTVTVSLINYHYVISSGGVESALCTTESIIEYSQAKTSISIYPNPSFSNKEITFTYPSSGAQREIILNDINGKETARYSLPPWSSVYHAKLPQMHEGIYVARIVGEGMERMVKFVVE